MRTPFRRVHLAGFAACLACPAAKPDPGGGAPTAAASDPAEDGEPEAASEGDDFTTQAHTEALLAAEAPAEEWLRVRSPVETAAAWGEALRAPRIDTGYESEVAEARTRFVKAIAGLRDDVLELRPQRILQAYRFATARDQWWYGKGGVDRSDPHAYLRRLAAMLEEIERRTRFGLAASPQDDAQIDEALRVGVQQLPIALMRTTSLAPGVAASAAELAGDLAGRCEALARRHPSVAPRAEALAAAFRTHAAALEALDAEILRRSAAGEPTIDWEIAVGSERQDPNAPPSLRARVWGKERTEAALTAEEEWQAPAELGELVEANLARFRRMRQSYPATKSRAKASPVDLEACAAAWAPLQESFLALEAPKAGTLDCSAIVAELEGRPMTPGQLEGWMLREVFAPAHRRNLAAGRGGQVGAIWGEAQPWTARHLHTVMFGVPLEANASVREALDELIDGVCLTTTALSVHASIGVDPEKLDLWLADRCPQQSPARWREAALRDPRGSWRGLPAAVLGPGPIDMVGLAEYSWAPMGVAESLAEVPKDADARNGAGNDEAAGAEGAQSAGGLEIQIEELN